MKRVKKAKSLRGLFRTPKTWTQGTFARNCNGYEVSVCDRSATQFCLIGGLRYVYGQGSGAHHRATKRLTEYIHTHFGKRLSIFQFNDNMHRKFEDIQSVIRGARV